MSTIIEKIAKEPNLMVIHLGKKVPDEQVKKISITSNCRLETTNSLEEGIKIIENPELKTPFDAVIFELPSDPENENSFIHFIERYHKIVPCLIFIGDYIQREEILEKMSSCYIHDFLIRPLSYFDLNRVIQHIINHKIILEENKILKNRLNIFEHHINHIFTKIENRVKRNIEKLSQTNEIWQRIFDQIKVGILWVNKGGTIVKANNSFSQIIGKPVDEVVGQKYSQVMQTDYDLEKSPGCLAMKTGKVEKRERLMPTNNNHFRRISQTGIPLFGQTNNINGFIEYQQDITEEKTEQKMFIQLEKIKGFEKLEAFLSREHLSSLRESVIDIDNPKISLLREYIIDQINMADQELGDPHLVNINDLIKKILKCLMPAVENNIEIVFDFEMDLPLIQANEFHLARAFLHLIDNALESMFSGGQLKITTRKKPHEIEIFFSDTGTGIPEEIKYKIFEPFFTSKSKRFGLGLNISKSILESYKGKILLQTNKSSDQNTTFIITLPIHSTCQNCQPSPLSLSQK